MRRRKSMLECNWPAADLLLWNAAVFPSELFEGNNRASRWRPKTVKQAKYAYATWLQHLRDTDPTALQLCAAERVTLDRIQRYITSMRGRLSAVSIAAALGHFVLALRAVAPNHDWCWVTSIQRKELALAPRPDKRPSMVGVEKLVALGTSLMANAQSGSEVIDHLGYRDGLIMALLAVRPLRRSNMAGLRLNKHIAVSDDQVRISFDASEMKGNRDSECWVPSSLVGPFVYYVTTVRPRFPGAGTHDFVWCSMKGGSLRANGLYEMIVRRTSREFGKRIYPHLFRDIAATAIATDRPDEVRLARDLLGHASLLTTEKHYLHAQSVKAGAHYGALIKSLRKRPVGAE
jgi:integrase/recombinase XerD